MLEIAIKLYRKENIKEIGCKSLLSTHTNKCSCGKKAASARKTVQTHVKQDKKKRLCLLLIFQFSNFNYVGKAECTFFTPLLFCTHIVDTKICGNVSNFVLWHVCM